MIYFNFYTERWLASTDGLTAVQECMYLRLVLWQYRNECKLPLDLGDCCRIARATGRVERMAVRFVLERFYDAEADGYTQAKVTHEVNKYHQGEPARMAKREANNERKTRSRVTMRALYSLARQHGVEVRGGLKIGELREVLEQASVDLGPLREVADRFAPVNASRSPPVEVTEVTGGVTEEVTGEVTEFYQQSMNPREERGEYSEAVAGARAREASPPPGQAGAVCRAMMAYGLDGVNPAHPTLLRLLAAGVPPEDFRAAASAAKNRGKPRFAYVLAMVEGWHADAAASRAQALAIAPLLANLG